MTTLGDQHSPSSLSATYADRVRELISEDRIADARQLVEEGLEAISRDPHLNRLRRLLAPPRSTRVDKQDVDRSEEFQWLARHAGEYQGRWVAIQGSELVAAAATLKELRQALRSRELEIPPLIHRFE